MSEVKKFVPLLLVITGAFNVLIIKWADGLDAKGSDGMVRHFQHPLLQVHFMFLGQALCLIFFKGLLLILQRRRDGSEDSHPLTEGQREFSLSLFLVPALLDIVATGALCTGLYLTYATSFQMLRVFSLIFVGIFTFQILNQNYPVRAHHWLGMLTISLGTFLVCLADAYNERTTDRKAVVTGDLLILCSQIFHGVQYVFEEKIIKALDVPPLQAVGWQGAYGWAITLLFLLPLNFIKADAPFDNNSRGVIEDLPDAFYQLMSSFPLVCAHVMFIISCSVYSFAATSIMKDTSSTNRLVIDSVRIVFIWLIAFALGWEGFNWLRLVAFLLLMSGICVYRNIVFAQSYRWVIGRLSRRNYGDLAAEGGEVTSTPADAI